MDKRKKKEPISMAVKMESGKNGGKMGLSWKREL